MKIRTRSQLILAAMALVFLIGLGYITQVVIVDSFQTIEKQEMTANVQRVIANINNQEAEIAANCKDWAGRDETYAFAGELNSSPDPVNTSPPFLLEALNIDYIFIYDISGNLTFSDGAVTSDGTPEIIPGQLDEIIKNSIVPEGVPQGISGRRGMSFVNNEPVLLSGYSIVGSNQSSPSKGTLVMARVLTGQRINDMESGLQIPEIGIRSFSSRDSAGVPLSAEDTRNLKKGGIISEPVDNTHMVGTAVISGIENKPTFLQIQVMTLRPMYQQVQSSILIVAGAMILLIAVFIIAVQLLLQRFVLGPLSNLDTDIKIIARSGDLSRRMPEKGDKEIVSLTRSLNHMLDELQEKRDALAEARRELALRNQDLEELNRKANLYLDIYLDVLTYEILNAIMGLRGYAEYLEESAPDTEKHFLKKIVELAEKSNNVIRNIETISRIYKMPPRVMEVDLTETIRKEINDRSNARLVINDCDYKVLANDMLGVVFDNIFSNSLKFGGPETLISVSSRVLEEGLLEISVTDTGPGIIDAMKSPIFDRFARDSTTRSSYGLGLHIVKMLVEGYGGSVRADDRVPHDPSSGAAIRFTLHLAG
ncbi:MAG: ATP-binding protein [Methanoregula sp.]|nr:ATP-binding protein [Methanoregula sp.]